MHKNKNIVRVIMNGGLGNQLFQYAAGYALAKKNNAHLVLNIHNYAHYENRSYRLDAYDINAEVENIPFDLSFKKNRFFKKENSVFNEDSYQLNEAFFNLLCPVTLNGYFQSAKYFSGLEDSIRNDFKYKGELSQDLIRIKESILTSKNAVALHIRRGDYLLKKHSHMHPICDLDYYQKAVEIINALLKDEAQFYIFTDDVEWVRENITFIKDYKIVSEYSKNEHEDLHLMSCCKHNIIANSTFSWWGAWLGQQAKKIVIAPRKWFSEKAMRDGYNMCDFYLDSWILL